MPRREQARLVGTVLALVLAVRGGPVQAERCRFHARPVRVGDAAVQTVQFETNVIVTFSQNGQTIDTTTRGVARTERRAVTVLGVRDGTATRARIAFVTSEQVESVGGGPAQRAQRPVAGKTYLAARTKRGNLEITDLQGNRPPPAERAIVALAMEALGRTNPLARFFDGRVVDMGQTVSLPQDLANDALGFRQAVGDVTRFDMTLQTLQAVDNHLCAVFATRIDALSPLADQQTLAMTGRVVLEVDTCRPAAIEVTCPLTIAETRGPEGGAFLVQARGTLQVSMRSRRGLPDRR